jgi:hypothetical protein
MNLTKHFTLAEMQTSNTATRLGLNNTIPPELIPNARLVAEKLEVVRAAFGKPVRVHSCYRAPSVNAAVGGSATSAHRFALAADFTIPGVSVLEVCRWCAENITDFDQVIYEFGEGGWIHLGFRKENPRKEILTAAKQNSRTVYTKGLPVA